MAELAIIAVAAVIAPVLVAVAIALGRSVGLIPRGGQQAIQRPISPRPAPAPSPAPLESVTAPGPKNRKGAVSDEVRFCQECGHATATRARYCRACGTLLDPT